MSDDEEIPRPGPRRPERDPSDDLPRRSRAELDIMVETMWSQLKAQQAQLDRLQKRLAALDVEDDGDTRHLARWLTFPPPPAAEDKAYRGESPLFTVANFVQYYNETYVGKPGSRAVSIPDCWLEHPGLVAELATLTYTWRAAHIGKNATARDAQYWHDRWRVGFAERLVGEWTHAHCLADGHRSVGAEPRADRYTLEYRTNRPDPDHDLR